ncbi:MAG: ATP synthase subunit I [Halanaerobiales bacterium]
MKNIDNPGKLQKEILKKSYSFAVFFFLYNIIMGNYNLLLGYSFGLVIATLILRLRYIHIKRSLEMEKEKANSYIRNRYFIEYIIYFVVLITARRNENLHFLAAVMGLFTIKFTVLVWTGIDLVKTSLENKLESFKK